MQCLSLTRGTGRGQFPKMTIEIVRYFIRITRAFNHKINFVVELRIPGLPKTGGILSHKSVM
jgi:hypothetical protein